MDKMFLDGKKVLTQFKKALMQYKDVFANLMENPEKRCRECILLNYMMKRQLKKPREEYYCLKDKF